MKKLIAGLFGVTTLAGGGIYGADTLQNPYEDKETHYELPIVSDIPQGERVEIAKDKAQMTLKGWRDEYAIKITPQIPTASLGAIDRPFTVPADRKLLSKKMEYRSGDVTAFIEPKGGTENEFDIDFTLHRKPDTNVFEYKIEGAEEFDFFYQGELTPEEIAEGASRPENVVGSYAVYHKTKANHRVGSTNYATGKAFHILRPKAIDANGAETWAELNYVDGLLSVTVPQNFLDDAAYPVRVDPTFGYTTIGASSFALAVDSIRVVSTYPASENGTVTMLTAYHQDGSGQVSNVRPVIYSNADNALLTYGAETIIDDFTAQWRDHSVTPATVISGANYDIGFWLGGTGNVFFYDANAYTLRRDTETYHSTNAPPSTFVEASTIANRQLSIYATYTASVAATGAPPVNLKDSQTYLKDAQVYIKN